MATKSTKVKMQKMAKLIEKFAAKREQLKKEGNYEALAKLPRNSSATRFRNICKLTGRSRAYYRKFGLSRIMVRQLANQGKIPGMRAASW